MWFFVFVRKGGRSFGDYMWPIKKSVFSSSVFFFSFDISSVLGLQSLLVTPSVSGLNKGGSARLSAQRCLPSVLCSKSRITQTVQAVYQPSDGPTPVSQGISVSCIYHVPSVPAVSCWFHSKYQRRSRGDTAAPPRWEAHFLTATPAVAASNKEQKADRYSPRCDNSPLCEII